MEWLSHDVLFLIELAVLGLGVGFLTGLFGVGGGFIVTPVMISILGIDPTVAVGSSLGFTLGASALGLRRHWRAGNFESRTSWLVGAGATAGTFVGYFLHQLMSTITGAKFDWFISFAFVVLLFAIALIIGFTADRVTESKSLLSRLRLPPYIAIPKIGVMQMSVTGLLAAGLLTGTLSGFFGIGGGIVLMPILILVVGLTPHLAVGTSLGTILLSSAVGCALYAIGSGTVDLGIVATLIMGSWFGTILGAKLCRRLHAEHLHRLFAIVVALTAVLLLINSLRQTEGTKTAATGPSIRRSNSAWY